MGPQGRVRVVAREVGGGLEKLEAGHVGGGPPRALVHIAAAYPGRARSHAYLVAQVVVACRGAGGVGAVAVVAALDVDGVAAGVGDVWGDRAADPVPPVEVVVGGRAVPDAIMGFAG